MTGLPPAGSSLVASGLYGVLLALLGVGLSLVLCRGRRMAGHLAAGFLVAFGLRVLLVLVNETFGLLDPKLAGNAALHVYERLMTGTTGPGLLELAARETFFVQAVVNVPGFALFGASRMNLLLTNAFLGAFTAVLAGVYLARLAPGRSWMWAFWLFALYPAAVNFSIFGLREPVVVLFVTTYVLAGSLALFSGKLSAGSRLGHGMVAAGSLLPLVSLRVELMPVLLVLPAWWLAAGLWSIPDGFASRFETWASRLLLTGAVLTVAVPAGLGVYRVAISAVGVDRIVSPVEFVERYTTSRYFRAVEVGGTEAGTGAGSHIVPPELYASLPVPAAVALQVVGLVVLPLPWLLTDVMRWMAFGDSLVVMWCLWMVYRWGRRTGPAVRRRAVKPLMICFLLGILGMGLVVVNAGNGFRMRLSIMPLLLAATAVSVQRWSLSRLGEVEGAGAE